MIRLKSLQDVLDRKDKIPSLAYIRGVQFLGSEGFDPEIDGWIAVIQAGDDIKQIIGPIDEAEYIDAFIEDNHIVFEAVFLIDDSMSIALIIPDEPWLDPGLRKVLLSASPAPMPLPQIQEVMP